MDQKKDLAS